MQKARTRVLKSCGLLLALTIVLLAAAMHLLLRKVWNDLEAGTQPDLSYIQQMTHIGFPASTKLVHSQYWSIMQGRDMRVNVEMNRADVRGFLEKNFKKEEVTRYDDPVLPAEKRRHIVIEMFPPTKPLDWWHPESVQKFLVVTSSANLVIGLDDPKHADVWMFWTH